MLDEKTTNESKNITTKNSRYKVQSFYLPFNISPKTYDLSSV